MPLAFRRHQHGQLPPCIRYVTCSPHQLVAKAHWYACPQFGPILRERLMSRMLTGNSDSDLQTLLAEDEATRTYRAGMMLLEAEQLEAGIA
eukprot:1146468-Pelagomonas_calceolata.AAC.3